jgi:hypothetical protein
MKMLGVSGRAFCEVIALVSDTPPSPQKTGNSIMGKQVSAKLKAAILSTDLMSQYVKRFMTAMFQCSSLHPSLC